MTSNCYIIDSSSLIELNRHNPIDVFPSVWKNMESLVNKSLLIAPKEVLNEIKKKDDQLAKWAKKQNNLFKDPTPKQIEILKDILKNYPALVKLDRKYNADAWVIALAIEMASGSQKTLLPIKRIVVTEEKLRGNKIKIPLVCQKYSIETIDIIDMFRIEGWKF
ncbi:MAG: twitching motility protein PilT [Candidatus Woesearchaeota archaeon]|nr:MAG: twitching motility protein PilT [Candidatus Woesearchaeota archaeon]